MAAGAKSNMAAEYNIYHASFCKGSDGGLRGFGFLTESLSHPRKQQFSNASESFAVCTSFFFHQALITEPKTQS